MHSCPLGWRFKSSVDLNTGSIHDFWGFKANMITWLSSHNENGRPECDSIWNHWIPDIPPSLLWVVDECCWVDLHNGRTRDLQFTWCLLHIHKGGGSELFGYGQSNSYMVGTEQVRLSVQQGERRSSQDVEVVGEEGREWGVTEVSDFFLHPSCPSTSSYLLDLTYPVTEVLS